MIELIDEDVFNSLTLEERRKYLEDIIFNLSDIELYQLINILISLGIMK